MYAAIGGHLDALMILATTGANKDLQDKNYHVRNALFASPSHLLKNTSRIY
jgi:hypothetical protein